MKNLKKFLEKKMNNDSVQTKATIIPFSQLKDTAVRIFDYNRLIFTVEENGIHRRETAYDQFGDPLAEKNEMILSRECFIEAFTKYIEAYMKDRNNDKL